MTNTNRKIWIDWFKVIGMVLIIWGHMFPYYFSDFVYAFSVPVFFWASGYLANTDTDKKVFFHKIWKSLVVPYVLICIANLVASLVISHSRFLSLPGVLQSLAAIPLGIQRFPSQVAVGVGSLWFVYALGILKIIHRFTNLKVMAVMSVVALLIIWLIKPSDCCWAAPSTFLCMPFYTLGAYCRRQNTKMLDRIMKLPSWWLLFVFIVATVALYVLSGINSAPYFYKLEYGNYILLMLFNALLGILLLAICSKYLERYSKSHVILPVLNAGMIVILGFQRWFVLLVTYFTKPRISNHFVYDMLTLVLSILILLMFVPIIKQFAKYFPPILGYRKSK